MQLIALHGTIPVSLLIAESQCLVHHGIIDFLLQHDRVLDRLYQPGLFLLQEFYIFLVLLFFLLFIVFLMIVLLLDLLQELTFALTSQLGCLLFAVFNALSLLLILLGNVFSVLKDQLF